jgi:hypothetical protein
VDTIEFSDAPKAGHTAIDYTAGAHVAAAQARPGAQPLDVRSRFARSLAADIRLKGLLSLFTFMVAGDIRALAVDAKAGMERAFAEGRHTAAAAAAADSTAQ